MKNFTYSAASRAFISFFLLGLSLVSFGQSDSASSVHFGFVFPLSTNGRHAASYTNRFSLHAIAGLSKAETGAAISGAANLIKQDASGLQLAGAVNVITNNAKGIQIAGAANVVGNDADGIQIAGFANVIKKEAKGAQIAGFMNLAGKSEAAQIAGFANISRNNAKGVQVAGFLNKGSDVNGQIAGFANVAKKVKGVQLAGFINIADSSDYPIAIFNFIKNGEKSIAVTVDESLTSMASFRSGGRVLYGIAGVGYSLKNDKYDLYAVEAGLGAHVRIRDYFRLNLEAVSQSMSNFKKAHYQKNALRILPGFKFGNKFEIFAGPTVNYVTHKRDRDFDFVDKYIWKDSGSKNFQGIHFGFNTGIQLLL